MPIFSKSRNKEMWVLLLEKAYAKMYGSYIKLENGIAMEALRDLTGTPYEVFPIDPENP
jgi:calpain-15